MQEVCSSLDTQLGIKSELSPLITGNSAILSHQQQQQQQPHQSLLGASSPSSLKMSINCDKRESAGGYWLGGGPGGVVGTESGFINSQPSMAEFLTQIDPESPKMGSQVFPMVSPSDSGGGMDGVPEYPWMKEKKTARKNSATQGERIQKGFVSRLILRRVSHSVQVINREYYSIIFDRKLFMVNHRGSSRRRRQLI